MRARHICLNRAHGTFYDQTNANGSGKMEYDVRFIHQLRQKLAILDWFEKAPHAVIFLEATDIFHAARRKIIEQQDFIAISE
jgi:hypothetical protein